MSTTVLPPQHERMLLEESAIDPRVERERGYRTVEDPTELQTLGFASLQCRVPALLVTLHGPHGGPVSYQARSDIPRQGDDGREIKNETRRVVGWCWTCRRERGSTSVIPAFHSS